MPYRIVAYYFSGSSQRVPYRVTDIPAEKLTHVNFAFFNVSPDGLCIVGDPALDLEYRYPGDPDGEPYYGHFRQLNLLKQRHPHLQTLMSVGGWGWSGHFSDAALTAESRARFAHACLEHLRLYGFDGVDIDWEYPVAGGMQGNVERPEDRQNFTALLAELRRQLDAQGAQDGRPYLLTVATPAGVANYGNLELDRIHAHLDWINLMTYDFASFTAETKFNAPLYAEADGYESCDTAVRDYLAAGIPPEKIVLGVPFYGRGWLGVPPENDGLHQPFAQAWTDLSGYRDLARRHIPTMERHWHVRAQVPWLYDRDEQVMITYDDAESIGIKADYVKALRLGGMMFWEISQDDADCTLLNALYTRLRE
jgi:chitinase